MLLFIIKITYVKIDGSSHKKFISNGLGGKLYRNPAKVNFFWFMGGITIRGVELYTVVPLFSGGIRLIKYYRSNGLYDYLDRNPNLGLKFPKGDHWALLYADKQENFTPKVIAQVIGVNGQVNQKYDNNAMDIRPLLGQISAITGLPLVTIEFRTDRERITDVNFCEGDGTCFKKISLNQLAKELDMLGLPLNNQPTSHAINDASSSAYQNWQRDNLGNKIVAVDIDMFRVSDKGDLIRFYELKRSFKSLEEWKPYVDDYNNFRALSKLANQTGVQLDIIYNNRTKKPWVDNVNELSIFNVDFNKQSPISVGKRISLEEFMRL